MKIVADDFGLSMNINAAILELASEKKLTGVSVMVSRIDKNAAEQISNANVQLGIHLENLIFDPEASIKNQLAAFRDFFGKDPDFLDGHRHIHVYPFILEKLIKVLSETELGKTAWVRSTNIHSSLMDSKNPVKRLYLRWLRFLGIRAFRKLKLSGISTNEYLWGAFAGHKPFEICMEIFLKKGSPKDLLIAHPGIVDEQNVARRTDYLTLKK